MWNRLRMQRWIWWSVCCLGLLLSSASVRAETKPELPTAEEAAGEHDKAKEKPKRDGMVALAAALAIGIAALATGFAQAKIGAAGMGAIAEDPKRLGGVIMLVAIPETVAILGFVVAYLILN